MYFVFALLAVLCIICSTEANECNEGNANAFIDEILVNSKPDLAQRIHLPDIISGETNLTDIYVWGFDSLKRSGDVCFEDTEHEEQTVYANFEVFNVCGSARGSYRKVFKAFGRKIAQKTFGFGVNAVIPHVKVRIELKLNTFEEEISLIECEFVEFDNAKFKVNLSGVWKVFNFVANRLADRFGNKQLKLEAQNMVRDSIAKAVNNFDKFYLLPQIP